MTERRWKIGELAAATGLTVRTLRHFHQIGLLCPSERSAAGHRLYTGDDVRRLYRILALRELRVSLGEIADALDGDGGDLRSVLVRQLDQVERQVALHSTLRRRLRSLDGSLSRAREPSIDQLIDAMEATMQAKNFTDEQFARLRQRHEQAGEEGFARWRQRMAELADRLAGHAERATDPADPEVQELAREWSETVVEMTGDDRSVLSALYAKIDRQGPETATKGVLTTPAWDYLRRAFAVGFGRT
ncbi:MerR family transcriptional regulator [Nonomuraea jiangxiensis]|uniref:DNA-binding transcriptional regulator, MerR family n=1 Tax=Nonomuraea jiangxiensis TaxID=633440 RepID=A0A1G8I1T1_9ACTN|nr:MerR family transcriptional regulator [Nonomuraea jiangxiensis]SDI12797.1 DNA-binding transcriptional regulator, MerR family [Nonomuraea jiangxiensis]